MKHARELLYRLFSDISFTESIWTLPVDIKNTDSKIKYLNCLARIDTSHELAQIEPVLKQVERQLGRSKGEKSLGIVRIDIDILMFDEEKHHLRDWERSYIHYLLKYLT